MGILSPHGVLLRRELCWWAFWPEQRWGLRKSEGKDPAVGGGAVLSCPAVMGYNCVTPWETLF